MLVEPVGGGDDVEGLLHVFHDAGLELESREGAGGARHEHRDGAVAEAGLPDGLGDLIGDLDHVGVAATGELDRAGDDAGETLAHVGLLLIVDDDGCHWYASFQSVASSAGYALAAQGDVVDETGRRRDGPRR